MTVSRAKQHLSLYTADKVALMQQARTSGAKRNASDYIPLSKVVNGQARDASCGNNLAACRRQDMAGDTANITPAREQQQTTKPSHQPMSQFGSGEELNRAQKRRYYQQLWSRYSQNAQTRNLIDLDYWVARKAMADGLGQKDAGLMLSAGSLQVRQIAEQSGQRQAVFYVNQLVRRLYQQQSPKRVMRGLNQLEL